MLIQYLKFLLNFMEGALFISIQLYLYCEYDNTNCPKVLFIACEHDPEEKMNGKKSCGLLKQLISSVSKQKSVMT